VHQRDSLRILYRVSTESLRDDLRRQFVEFLLVDAELGITFAALAQAPQRSLEGRRRSYENARRAFEVVRRMTQRVLLTENESGQLHARIERLKTILAELSEELK
jgi:hypothetical protein